MMSGRQAKWKEEHKRDMQSSVMNIEWIISIWSFSEYRCHATIEGLRLQLEKGRVGKTVYQVLLVDIIKYNQRQQDGRGSLVAYPRKIKGSSLCAFEDTTDKWIKGDFHECLVCWDVEWLFPTNINPRLLPNWTSSCDSRFIIQHLCYKSSREEQT